MAFQQGIVWDDVAPNVFKFLADNTVAAASVEFPEYDNIKVISCIPKDGIDQMEFDRNLCALGLKTFARPLFKSELDSMEKATGEKFHPHQLYIIHEMSEGMRTKIPTKRKVNEGTTLLEGLHRAQQ